MAGDATPTPAPGAPDDAGDQLGELMNSWGATAEANAVRMTAAAKTMAKAAESASKSAATFESAASRADTAVAHTTGGRTGSGPGKQSTLEKFNSMLEGSSR